MGDEFVVDFEFYGYCTISECHCWVSDPKNRGCQSCREFCEGVLVVSNVGSGAGVKILVGFRVAKCFGIGHVC